MRGGGAILADSVAVRGDSIARAKKWNAVEDAAVRNRALQR